jgi:hypothetical protein
MNLQHLSLIAALLCQVTTQDFPTTNPNAAECSTDCLPGANGDKGDQGFRGEKGNSGVRVSCSRALHICVYIYISIHYI